MLYVCIRIFNGTLKRNHIAGFRIKKAFESEEMWMKVNRYGARLMLIPSLVTIGCGIVMIFIRGSNPPLLIFSIVVVIVSLIAPIIVFFWRAPNL